MSWTELDEAVESLLDRAYFSESIEETEELVKQALEIAPDHPEVLLLQADLMEDEGARLSVLMKAKETASAALAEENIPEDEFAEDELGMIYLALLQRLAFTLFSVGDEEQSYEIVEELLRHDLGEEGSSVKNLYYRLLVERQDWAGVFEAAEKDSDEQLGKAYALVFAEYMLADRQGRSLEEAVEYFLDALEMSPNVPFYILGYFSDPVEDTEMEEADFHFSILFADACAVSHSLLNWFSRHTILFGLLTERFGDEKKDMVEILRSLGGEREYRRLLEVLRGATSDESVIDVLREYRAMEGTQDE